MEKTLASDCDPPSNDPVEPVEASTSEGASNEPTQDLQPTYHSMLRRTSSLDTVIVDPAFEDLSVDDYKEERERYCASHRTLMRRLCSMDTVIIDDSESELSVIEYGLRHKRNFTVLRRTCSVDTLSIESEISDLSTLSFDTIMLDEDDIPFSKILES